MANQTEYQVLLKFDAQGGDQTLKITQGVVEGLEGAHRAGILSSKGLLEFSKALNRVETASGAAASGLGKMSTAARKMTPEFAEVNKEVQAMTRALQEQAQIAAAGGSQTPMSDAVKAVGLTEADVKLVERHNEALGVDATSAAKTWRDEQGKSSQQLSLVNEQLYRQEQALKAQEAASKQSEGAIVSLRYANYDLATTLLRTSAAITAVGAASLTAFASQERAFTDVERTLEGGTIESVEALRQSFIDLSTEIPKSFNELSEIATLGNQLGVAADDLEAFTRTVSAFSTVTGISADAASQAFGKLGNLLSVSVDDYDRLGSAIALVGRTTAATEDQIISIASEIAPAAAAAGLSADAVIGLSGALGSLRVPPERSRSTILQFFETLNSAVAKGGQDLDNFAKVVGVTSAELEGMVRSGQGEDVLARFVSSASVKDTVEITQALQELGLAGLRTNPTIRALAGNMDLFNSSIQTGKQGFAENTELQRQMSMIVDDLSSKFQMLLNAVVNFAAQVGSEMAPAFGTLIDLATQGLVALTEFAQSPVGESLIRTVSVISGAVAVWTALRGAVALATASTYAFLFVVRGLGGAGIVAGLKNLSGAMLGVASAGKHGAAAVFTLRGAVLALGRAVVIGAIFSYIAEWIFNTGEAAVSAGKTIGEFANFLLDAGQAINDFFGLGSAAKDPTYKLIRGWSDGLQSWGNSLKKQSDLSEDFMSDVNGIMSAVDSAADSFDSGVGPTDDFGDSLGGVGDAAKNATKEVRTLVDYANDLKSVWERAFEIRFSGSSSRDAISSTLISLKEEAEAAAKRVRDLRTEIQGMRADMASLKSDIAIQEYFLSIAIEYGDTQRATAIEAKLGEMRADLAKKTDELQDKQKALKDEQAAASKTLQGNSKAAIENRKTIQGLVQEYQAHIGALAASGMSQADLARATQRLKEDFIQQATQLGYNRRELQVYAKAFDDVAVAIAKIPRNVTVSANANPAIQALNELRSRANTANTAINTLRSNAGRGISVPSINTSGYTRAGLAAEAAGLRAKIAQYNLAVTRAAANSAISPWTLSGLQSRLSTLKGMGYWSGGFTGTGGKYEPAGIVHRGEYVIPKNQVNQATGLPYADALGRLMTGVPGLASGGATTGSGPASGTGTVALSAGSIQAIAQAVQPYIIVDGQKLGQISSNAYSVSNSVGAN